MTYEYQCQNEGCHVVQELVLSSHKDRPESVPCRACGGTAVQVVLHAPSVSRQGSSDESFDSAVGRDAEQRWGAIHDRQAKRDKVRKESGEAALSLTGFDDYKPLPGAKLEFVETKSSTDPGDKK